MFVMQCELLYEDWEDSFPFRNTRAENEKSDQFNASLRAAIYNLKLGYTSEVYAGNTAIIYSYY
jgi:hypothetical protein